MSEMIPTDTSCARNLPQHFNGCSCTTPSDLTAEAVDVDLVALPTILSAPASTNPKAAPFGRAATLEDLADHYEALTSPENISWDGERSHGAAQAEARRLGAAYWVRRDEIDPKRERAFCPACRAEVPGQDGEPTAHDNDLGRECWGGR